MIETILIAFLVFIPCIPSIIWYHNRKKKLKKFLKNNGWRVYDGREHKF